MRERATRTDRVRLPDHNLMGRTFTDEEPRRDEISNAQPVGQLPADKTSTGVS